MPFINDATLKAKEQAAAAVETGERLTLAWLDVAKATAAIAVPVLVVPAPNKDQMRARLDNLVDEGYAAAAQVVTAAYARLADTLASATDLLPVAA